MAWELRAYRGFGPIIVPLEAHFLGLIRLSLVLARSSSGVILEILPGAGRLNNPKLLDQVRHFGASMFKIQISVDSKSLVRISRSVSLALLSSFC